MFRRFASLTAFCSRCINHDHRIRQLRHLENSSRLRRAWRFAFNAASSCLPSFCIRAIARFSRCIANVNALRIVARLVNVPQAALINVELAAASAASLIAPAPASCTRRKEFSTATRHFLKELGRAMKLLHRLIEIDDVNLIALLEDGTAYFGFALGLVTECTPLPKAQALFNWVCHTKIAPQGGDRGVEDALRMQCRNAISAFKPSLLRGRRRDAIARSGPIQPSKTKRRRGETVLAKGWITKAWDRATTG